jgi:hypothetical protein
MPGEVFKSGAAILKSCLDDIDDYEFIEGEITTHDG